MKLLAVAVLAVVMFAPLLVVPGPVHAASEIEVDDLQEIDNAGVPAGFPDPASWPHTIGTGSNRILLAGVAYGLGSAEAYLPAMPVAYGSGALGAYGPAAYRPANSFNPVTSVTFGGNPLTFLVGTSSLSGLGVQVYYMLNPPIGTATITIDFSSPVAYALAGSVSFFNVMGIGVPAYANDNGGTVSDMQVTVSANSGDIVLDMLATQLGSNVNPGPGQAAFWEQLFGNEFVVAGSAKFASSPVTMTWIPSGPVLGLGSGWVHVAVALQALPPTRGAPVGGFLEPVNKVAIAAPYLALFGVIGAVAVVYWKRPDN
jgi:hypothetical protein